MDTTTAPTARDHAHAAVMLATRELGHCSISTTETPDGAYHAMIMAETGHVTITTLDDHTIASTNYDARGARQGRVTFGVHGPASDIAARLVAAARAVGAR